ncbi:signal transduction histidine kinase [Geomicrobium halophilum]|uniref:Heme sensor protein HssS n=1 Tax=Geomicrobium halophilum TaxID=549000 RepID=A0A841Q0Q0_9BACL|nr:HAMP domain-containing sensor histidine kinase [Geomicrobium halophilum]MBB6450905.1 signal transduction histidine kinase [Geomicrobium halophilum]
MKSFYVRIVLITFTVMILSSLLAFIASNVYFQLYLKPINDEKIAATAEEVQHYMENNVGNNDHEYLTHIGSLGYQIVVIDDTGNINQFGRAFREGTLPEEAIDQVLAGRQYDGVAEHRAGLFNTGFFHNALENTVGVPVESGEGTAALFIRPDHEQQLGEFRFFLAMLVILTVILSFLFVALTARRIVKPIVSLTEATKKIASGSFNIALNVRRKDEIGQLAKHFTSMSKDLRQLEAMRQEFVSNVSHEIQSPLTTIKGITQSLQQPGLDEEQKKKYLQMIEKESGRLSSLSKQLLTLASLDNEDKIAKEQSVDVREQIKEIIQSLAYQWQEKELYIEMEGNPEPITGDENLLYQVWINVITNAIKFSESGGQIRIHMEEKKEDLVTVSIEDSGIGMQPSEVEKVFTRFYQADEARTPGKESTGLGLAIVRKIVDLHGGTIDVESTPGIGTKMVICLKAGRE